MFLNVTYVKQKDLSLSMWQCWSGGVGGKEREDMNYGKYL